MDYKLTKEKGLLNMQEIRAQFETNKKHLHVNSCSRLLIII